MIKFYNEFLSPDALFYARRLSTEIYYSPDCNLKTNAAWDDGLILSSFPIISHVIQDETLIQILDMHLKNIFPDVTYNACFHYFTQFSFIPWHDDTTHDAAMTIYLNDVDENSGGYFMYKEDGEIKAIQPKTNLAIFNKDVEHCTSAVHANSKLRQSIQIFFKKDLTN